MEFPLTSFSPRKWACRLCQSRSILVMLFCTKRTWNSYLFLEVRSVCWVNGHFDCFDSCHSPVLTVLSTGSLPVRLYPNGGPKAMFLHHLGLPRIAWICKQHNPNALVRAYGYQFFVLVQMTQRSADMYSGIVNFGRLVKHYRFPLSFFNMFDRYMSR